MLRSQFGAIQHDSGVVAGSLTPADYDLKINSNIIGSGHQFCDHLVRYPLILTLNEILPKDKKQKEDKIISHATFTMDLAAFLSGSFKFLKMGLLELLLRILGHLPDAWAISRYIDGCI